MEIRKELMDQLISKGIWTLEEYSDDWIKEVADLEAYAYNSSRSLYHDSNYILKYMIEEYPEYTYIYSAYINDDIDTYDAKNLLEQSLEFHLKDNIKYPYFVDRSVDESIENATLDSNDLFTSEVLKSLPLLDTEEYITEDEAIYITDKLEDAGAYNIDYSDIYDYVNIKDNRKNKTFYYTAYYTIYEIINFDTLEIEFEKQFPELAKSKDKEIIQSLKTDNSSNRKEYNILSKINNNTIKKIIMSLYRKDKDLNKFYTIKELNALSKTTPILKSAMSSRIQNNRLLDIFPNGFTLNNLLEIDSTLEKESISDLSIFKRLRNSDLIINFTKWNSPLQRVFLDDPNYVFQLNLKNEKYDEVLDYVMDVNDDVDIYKNIKKYIQTSIHPISRSKLTLAWIRFTKIDENEIVLDEIQTDMTNPTQGINTFNSEELMDGWEDIILSKFIKFIKYNLRIKNIYYPTVNTKIKKYKANAPTYLYSDLPKKYGFSSENSGLEGYMLLEKKKITN